VEYAYDGNANILDIEDALHGHYVMVYSNRNERILERNQDNFEWDYAYDELLRLQTQRDPNGTTRTMTYDDGGGWFQSRLALDGVTPFSPMLTIIRLYDQVRLRAVNDEFFQYDAMDRPAQYTDAFSKTVKYQYDAVGRVSILNLPGWQDAHQ